MEFDPCHAIRPPLLIRMNHLLVYVSDVSRSLEFYEGQLGFKPVEVGLPDYATVVDSEGQTTICTHRGSSERRTAGKDGAWLYIGVEDLDTVCKELARRGVEFEQMPRDMPWGWRHAYLRDPDGQLLSLYRAGGRQSCAAGSGAAI